jgi:hypothetical protein
MKECERFLVQSLVQPDGASHAHARNGSEDQLIHDASIEVQKHVLSDGM